MDGSETLITLYTIRFTFVLLRIFIYPHTLLVFLQIVPGGKVDILGGHSIDHSKQKRVYVTDGFRDRANSPYRRATLHGLTRVAKCTDVDDGIFENVLSRVGW
jgi:hypothetical protein